MRSEHGNSLHFISSAVHFLYKNFPKSRFSLHKHPPKKPFFGFFFQKNRSPKPRVGTPPGGGVGPPCRPADPRRPCYTKAWSEHGNSLHFISSAVHFSYKNFQKKYIFSTTTSPKCRFSLHKHPPKKPFFGIFFSKKLLPKTQGRHFGGGGRADPPTLADPAIPKTARIREFLIIAISYG